MRARRVSARAPPGRQPKRMDAFTHLIGLALAIGLIVAALICMVDPGRAWQLLKRIMVSAVALLFAVVLLRQLACSVANGNGSVLLPLLVVSIVAYVIREARKPKGPPGGARRGGERTPVVPPEFE